MVSVQLDRDVIEMLKDEKNRDETYNEILRRTFKELNEFRIKNKHIEIIPKDEVQNLK